MEEEENEEGEANLLAAEEDEDVRVDGECSVMSLRSLLTERALKRKQ